MSRSVASVTAAWRHRGAGGGGVASRERRPGVLVSGSAIGYYGDRDSEVLTEESAPGDDFLAQLCIALEGEAAPAPKPGSALCSP